MESQEIGLHKASTSRSMTQILSDVTDLRLPSPSLYQKSLHERLSTHADRLIQVEAELALTRAEAIAAAVRLLSLDQEPRKEFNTFTELINGVENHHVRN